jgi:hypothetical protein
MDDPGTVRGGEPARDLRGEIRGLGHLQAPKAREQLGEAYSADQINRRAVAFWRRTLMR